MLIVVDDASVDLELPRDNVKLGEVIQEVEDYLFSVGRVPISLAINDQPLSQEEMESRLEDLLKGEEALRFSSVTVAEFVMDNIKAVSGANQELLKLVKSFAEDLHSAQRTASPETLVQELNHFFDFWLRLNGMLPEVFDKVTFGERSLSELFEDIRKVLGETVQAMEDQDFVMAADLLRYEILPAIEAVDKGIPDLLTALEERLAAPQT